MVEGTVMEAIQADKSSTDVFSKIARAIGKRASSKRKSKDWNALVRKGTTTSNPIGSTSEAHAKRVSRQSIRKYIIENQSTIGEIDPEKLLQYNPKLSTVSPATRVAYAKFKLNKIKTEYEKRKTCASETSSFTDSVIDIKKAVSLEENRVPDTTVVEISREDNGEYEEAAAELEPKQPAQGFRPKTPIMEDPREDMQTPSIDELPGTPIKIPESPVKSVGSIKKVEDKPLTIVKTPSIKVNAPEKTEESIEDDVPSDTPVIAPSTPAEAPSMERASPSRSSLSPAQKPATPTKKPTSDTKQVTPNKFGGNWL